MTLDAGHVRHVFDCLERGDIDAFFSHVHDDVDWTLQGTHPLRGRYRGKQDFRANSFARMQPMLASQVKLSIRQILVSGDWAVVELAQDGRAKSGLRYAQEYAWIVRFAHARIAEVRTYLDTELLQQVFDAHPA